MKTSIVVLTVVAVLFAWTGVPRAQQAAEPAREDATQGEAQAPPAVEVVQPTQHIHVWVTVTASEAQIRSGPSTKYPEIDLAYRGDEFEATGRVRGWYFVRFGDDAEGWIASRSVVRSGGRHSYRESYPPPPAYYPYYYDDYPYWRGSFFSPFWWGGGFHWDDDRGYGRPDFDRGHRDRDDDGGRHQPGPPGPAPRFDGPAPRGGPAPPPSPGFHP